MNHDKKLRNQLYEESQRNFVAQGLPQQHLTVDSAVGVDWEQLYPNMQAIDSAVRHVGDVMNAFMRYRLLASEYREKFLALEVKVRELEDIDKAYSEQKKKLFELEMKVKDLEGCLELASNYRPIGQPIAVVNPDASGLSGSRPVNDDLRPSTYRSGTPTEVLPG